MDYGRIVYKKGDPSTGIYIILNGSFELSVTAHLIKTAEEIAANKLIEQTVKFKIIKKAAVQQDSSLKIVNIALLERGEVLGL